MHIEIKLEHKLGFDDFPYTFIHISFHMFFYFFWKLQADNFQRHGRSLRRKMWLQNFKVKLIVLAVIVVVIIVIYLSICHGFVCTHTTSTTTNKTSIIKTRVT
jgi:hypothetical protein